MGIAFPCSPCSSRASTSPRFALALQLCLFRHLWRALNAPRPVAGSLAQGDADLGASAGGRRT
eukprot:7557443-Pyramimonas_sp.AAC.1